MDILFEILADMLFEGAVGSAMSKKVPRPIRIILGLLIVLFIAAVIGLVFWVGIMTLETNMPAGIMIIIIAVVMVVLAVLRVRKAYLE